MARSHQLALPIGTIEPPETLLRKAHQECRLQQSFEEAMQLPHFRTALKRMAMIMAARGRKKK